MAYTLEDLGGLFRKLMYDTLCGGDGTLPPSKDSFITWCSPGLAYTEQDFDFAASGIGTAADAEGEKRLLQHAFNFASLIDFIPDPKAAYTSDRQQGVWRNEAGMRLSELYGQILKASKVVHQDLTPEQQAKLDKFRGLLRTTKTVKDIVTDEEKQVTEDGPMLAAYKQKQQAYITAALAYNAKRVAAQAATGVEGKAAVMDWANNAQLYGLQVKSAADDWTAGGYRNDVDEINAYINQTTEKSMLLWKQHLEEMLGSSVVSAPNPGEVFNFTTLTPGDFATSTGWTGFSMNHSSVDSSYHQESTSWSVGGGLSFGLFSVGGGVSSNSTEYSSNYSVDEFGLSFDMTQVQVIRPWFYPEFFYNQGWTLQKGNGWLFDQMPSDGAEPPTGLFVGYPLQAVFVRNVQIKSAAFASAYSAYSSSLNANASVGWGPFSVSGSYGHSESGDHYHATTDGTTVTIPGLQLIAFVNHLLGKTPNPLPELKDADFV